MNAWRSVGEYSKFLVVFVCIFVMPIMFSLASLGKILSPSSSQTKGESCHACRACSWIAGRNAITFLAKPRGSVVVKAFFSWFIKTVWGNNNPIFATSLSVAVETVSLVQLPFVHSEEIQPKCLVVFTFVFC